MGAVKLHTVTGDATTMTVTQGATPGTDPSTIAAIADGDITINGVSIGAIAEASATGADGAAADAAATTERLDQLVTAINAQTDKTGVTAAVENGELVLTGASEISVVATAATSGLTTGVSAEATAATGSLDDLDISNYSGAQLAIRQADAAMKQISEARAQLGALQSRFENAVSNIQISAENATSARSRIMDTDFAAETANMTRAQILQQAGNAMLSQANQLPQQVLSLLR